MIFSLSVPAPPAAETPIAPLPMGSVSNETMTSVALPVSIRMQEARLSLSPEVRGETVF